MTKGFAAKAIGLAGAVMLASILATSVGAQNAPSKPAMMVLFFDMQSARLTPEARTIVLKAVDAADRAQVGHIELAAYAAPDETARDPKLIERRAVAVRQQIADYGFRGVVLIDDETPELQLATLSDDTFDRRAVIRLGG